MISQRTAISLHDLVALALCLFLASSAQAATDTWSGASSGVWNLNGNWGSNAPVSTSNATFSNNVNTSVTLSSAGVTQTITFGSGAGAFTIGTTGGFGLTLTGAGNITNNATNIETVNAPLIIGNSGTATTYAFTSNSSTAADVLNIGGSVTGAASSGTTVLTLNGTNAGTNTVSGVIGDGTAGGHLAVTESGSGTWVLSNTNTYTGATTVSAGTLTLSTTGVIGSGGATAITVSGGTLNDNSTVATTGGITGTSTLTVSSGTATLNTANNYSGTTTVSGGTLNINNANAIGSGALDISSGTINSNGSGAVTLATNNTQAWSGNFTFTGTQALNLGTGAVALSNSPTVTMTAGTLTVGGVISGSGDSLTVTGGTGTLVLNGNNTYSGGTTVSSGTLTLAGTNTGAGGVEIDGGQLNINNNSALGGTAGTFTITGGTIDNTSNGAVTTSTNPVSIVTNGESFTFGGTNNLTLGGAVALFEASAGSNTDTTTITVNGSTLTLSGAVTSSSNHGTETLTVNGAGNLVFGSSFALNSRGSETNIFNGSGKVTISGGVSGSDPLTYSGTGTLALNGTSTYTGITTISSGTLEFGSEKALYNDTTGSWTTSEVKLSSGATYAFKVLGTATTGAGLDFTSADIDTLKGLGVSGSFIGLDTTDGNFTYANDLGSLVAGQGLKKLGINTLTLSGTNSYTGATTVLGGVLAVNGSLNASSAVTVGGASATIGGTPTLTGTGTVHGNVTLASAGGGAAGIINPGGVGTTGTLSIGGTIAFQSGSTFAIDMSGSSTDLLTITGAATITSGADIDITASSLTLGNYVLATAASGLNGNAFTVTGSLPSGYKLVATATSLDLQQIAVLTITPTAANYNAHVSTSTTIGVTVGNSAASGGASLTYNLTGAVTGSNLGPITPGGTPVTTTASYLVPSTAGVNNLSVTGTDVNNGSDTANASLTVTGYNLAAAATSQTINVGNVHAGNALTAAVTLANTAPTNATYTETLSSNGFTGTTSGFTATGSASGIAGGSNGSGTLTVGLGTGLAEGAQSGSTTLALNSNAVNSSGLGTTALTAQTITITGDVYDLAAAATSQTVNVGAFHVGVGNTAAVSLTNTAPTNATYTETLQSNGFSSTSSNFTATGSASGIAGGSSGSGSLLVGVGTGLGAGVQSGTTTLALQSNAVNGSGLGTTNIGTDTITINATGYNLAAAATLQTINVGNVHAGNALTAAVTLANTAPTNATYTETLSSNGFTGTTSGFTATGSASGIAGGSNGSGSLLVGLGTGLAEGAQSGSTTLALNSNAVNSSGLGTTALAAQTITIIGAVYDEAAAATSQTINLGNVHVGEAVTAAVTLANTAPANATYTETLSSNGFTGTTSGFTATGSASGIAGGSNGSGTLLVGLGSGLAVGAQSGTTTLALNSNAVNGSGLGTTALTAQTITIDGAVYSGQSTWAGIGTSGSWGTLASGFGTSWGTNQGSPGLDPSFTGVDTATFGTVAGGSSTDTVSLNGASPNLNSITFNSSSTSYTLAQGSGGAITLSGTTPGIIVTAGIQAISAPVVLGAPTAVNVASAQQLAFSGVVSGSNGLTMTGAGKTILSGASANTYTGKTTIGSGELDLDKTAGVNAITGLGGLNIASPDVLVNGGTLKWLASNQVADNATISLTSGAVNLNGFSDTIGDFSNSGGTFTTGAGKLIGTGASVTWSGGTNTVNAGGTVEDQHVVITGGTNTVQGGSPTGGVLQVDSGGTGLEMTGSTLTLNSDNTSAGELLMGNPSTSGTSSNLTTYASSTTSNISNGLSNTNSGVVDLNGGTSTFTVASGSTASGVDLGVSAVIQDGALTKSGAGTMVVSGANTYSGGTAVSHGTLYANGGVAGTSSATGTGAITVANGASLGGSGVIRPGSGNGITLASGGTVISGGIQAAASPTTLAGQGLTLDNTVAAGTILDASVGSADLTFYLGAGNPTSAGTYTFSNPDTASSYMTVLGNTAGEIKLAAGDTITLTDLTIGNLQLDLSVPYLLIEAGTTPDLLADNNLYSGITTSGGTDLSGNILNGWVTTPLTLNGNTTTEYAADRLYLYNGELEVVPEPSTWAMMIGGLAVLVFIQRRRRQD